MVTQWSAWLGYGEMDALGAGDPERIGRYRLIGRLGAGGMGQVFLAQSPGGRQVAVKLIRAELADDPEFRARFAREVATARNVSGMFTAPLVDADLNSDSPWLVTAYVPGPSLADAVERHGRLPDRAVFALAAGLAEGLGAIHAAGVVHRDLKPANVLLASDGPRIIDFGISRALGSSPLTRTDFVVGSPGFMSPEQAQGREAGPPSDIFCLGAVLVFAAGGQAPFGSGTVSELLYRIIHENPDIGVLPQRVRPLVERCLDKDPLRRPTADQMLAELGPVPPMADWLASWAGADTPGTAPVAAPAPAGAAATSYGQLPTTAEPAPAEPVSAPAGQTAGDDSRHPTYSSPTPAVPAEAAPPAWPSATTDYWPEQPPSQRQGERSPSLLPGMDTPRPGSPARPGRRRSARPIGVLLALVAIAAGAAAAIFVIGSHRSPGPSTGSTSRSATSSSPAATAPPGPEAVVRAYFAAISDHNWRQVWRLGGKNLGQTYQQMVAGYQGTDHDVIQSLTVTGDTVDVTILAYQTSGSAQSYRLRYVVQNGVIVSGHSL